ncbi:MAG: hypothetical protein R6W67_10125 [Bacteroidales bacterium]
MKLHSKSVIILFISFYALAGCSVLRIGPIQEYRDDFTGGRRYLLTEKAIPRERRTEIGNATMTFEKRVSAEGAKSTIYFIIERSPDSFRSEKEGYIKVNDTTWEVTLDDVSVESKFSGNITEEGVLKETGIITRIDEKFRIELSQEIVDAITLGRIMEIRIYFGPMPATYRIRGFALSRVSRLLSM